MENKIEVIPYIPDEDYDNPAMVVDFYEFTMATACSCMATRIPGWFLICFSARIRMARGIPSAPASAS